MSAGDFLPTEDTRLQAWLENFVTVCDKNETVLGLDAQSFGLISSSVTGFDNGLAGAVSARAASKAATTTKQEAKATVSAVVRAFAREFKGNPNVPASVLSELQILSNSVTGPVTTVTGVDVVGCDDGVNKLTWNRNGNAQGTTFVVEYKPEGTALWLFAAAVTKSKFDHVNQVPGRTTFYRITSSRAGVNSVPSVPVTAYPDTNSNPLSIAA